MRTLCLVLVGLLCCGGAVAVGCGADDGSAGTAPAISNLTHDATTLTVGTQGVINGSKNTAAMTPLEIRAWVDLHGRPTP